MKAASFVNRALLGYPRSAYNTIKQKRAQSVSQLENLFFDICECISPSLFVEAGAKDASASRRARDVLPAARIVAFEANPYTFKRFAKNPDNLTKRIEYLNRALSDKNGKLTFNVRIIKGRMSADGQGSLLASKKDKVPHEQVAVQGHRLDEFFPHNNRRRCAMWIDVEGASKEVLTGAENLLGTVDAMFIEVEERTFWDGQWLDHDVSAFLQKYGLIPIARDYQSLYQHNVLFLRSATASETAVSSMVSAYRRHRTSPATFMLDRLAARFL